MSSRPDPGPRRSLVALASKQSWIWFAAATALLLLGLSTSWYLKQPALQSSSTRELNKAATISARGGMAFANYAGSESCADCHPHEYKLWAGSHHALAERRLQSAMDQRAFVPDRRFSHASQMSEVRMREGQCEIVTLGLDSNIEPYRVERVIGHDPLRQFLSAAAGGRWQVHEVAYDPASNQWFDVFGDEDRRPGEYGHWTGRAMNWNSMCAECHNTRLRKNYSEATDTYETTMAEMGVGCEACHGPGREHVLWRRSNPDYTGPDTKIKPLGSAQILQLCGSCHSRRANLTGDFQPGDSLFDHFSLEILDDAARWYPDGQIRDEDYEFESFLSSRMAQNQVGCWDCHDMHSMKTLATGNDLCLRCHGGGTKAPAINPAKHGHHKLGDKGSQCVGCHMPVTVYMQRHPRRDHGFTIPDPLLTKQLGVPNACNRCHDDRSADWARSYTEEWYGTNMNRHTRERAQWIAAAQRGEDAGRDHLLEMLAKGEEPPYWRAVAAGLLWRWTGNPEVNHALLARLRDEHPLVRERAIRALEPLVQNGDKQTIGALRPMLDDPVRCVRVAAAWALRATLDLESRAGRELQAALDFNADQPSGQLRKTLFLLARGQPGDALNHLGKAIDWDSYSSPLRLEAAHVFAELGKADQAVQQLQVACRLEPKSADARFQLGLAWAQADRLDKAADALAEAVQLDPKHARAWYNLGLANSALGKPDEALRALDRAQELSPGDPGIPYAQATILIRVGKLNDARAAARRALRIQPAFKPAQELLARLPPAGSGDRLRNHRTERDPARSQNP